MGVQRGTRSPRGKGRGVGPDQSPQLDQFPSTDAACPGRLWAPCVQRRPRAPCPSDQACKDAHYFTPNQRIKIKLKKKKIKIRGSCEWVEQVSLNGGKAQTLCPPQPKAECSPGRRAGSWSVPARGDPAVPGPGQADSTLCSSPIFCCKLEPGVFLQII